ALFNHFPCRVQRSSRVALAGFSPGLEQPWRLYVIGKRKKRRRVSEQIQLFEGSGSRVSPHKFFGPSFQQPIDDDETRVTPRECAVAVQTRTPGGFGTARKELPQGSGVQGAQPFQLNTGRKEPIGPRRGIRAGLIEPARIGPEGRGG